ncbi:hypothetical protein J14TS2_39920 [Bacillus sp. J14TS2]|uniref:DUF2627 domain-containing protein n=1 Tax=Bacillus sp. J14TS2 TaxID=2807188 RepID=UPI001B0468BD|nr:DUF2627 domain-containing protein [Bacillus sp. J14TS2]GIN73517.1 hypothetical protein J14TS2_39920 [Bacillus sp. J14TS2]
MGRIVALVLLVIPVILAGYGIKLMRDMLFGILQPPFPFLWLQFLSGALLLVIGLGFISGFVLHRDKKKNKVQDRFNKNEGK